MNKWISEEGHTLRRLGKTGEELGEATAVVNRCIIQGIDSVDPSSGKTNRIRMEDEFADVLAQINCCIKLFNLDAMRIGARTAIKINQMTQWEAHYKEES